MLCLSHFNVTLFVVCCVLANFLGIGRCANKNATTTTTEDEDGSVKTDHD